MKVPLEFLAVAGCLLLSIAAETFVHPLDRNVIFLKERDIILSNDVWRIAIDVKMEP